MTPGGSFDLATAAERADELREAVSAPDLWNDAKRAASVTKELARLDTKVASVTKLEQRLEDAELMISMAGEERDESALTDAAGEVDALGDEVAILEQAGLYSGEYDAYDAIVSVHAGAGGVDAQDWAEMMLRMYLRYLERKGFEVEVDEVSPGEEAGIKSATITVRGEHAYGTMEGERGVHRLVRISPFDAASRRHTSFAAVDVIPETEVDEIEINEEDLRVETFRSQGAGGQHVNVTDSAVRITHLPTGIAVSCQAERSQLQNKTRAMQLLGARLAVVARQDQLDHLDEIRGEQGEAAWGRQLRSYVLQPYQMVKDLRTDVEIGNIGAVLDGDLDRFVEAYLQWRRSN